MTTPQDYIKSLQKDGVLLVIDGKLFFIPKETLTSCKMPDEFQKGFDGVSPAYFKPEGATDGSSDTSKVYRGITRVLAEAFVTDGVSQAVWLAKATGDDGRKTSKTAQSEQPIFTFAGADPKIVVDMTKGGRPSNR